MAKHSVQINVNGTLQEAVVESRLLLVHFLRENLRLTGTHIGCDTTHCGACTVAARRQAGQVVHRAGGPGRRPRGAHGRGAGARRQAPRGAGSLLGEARPAVRLLHAGHDDDRLRAARAQQAIRASWRSARPSPGISAAAPATSTSSRRSSTPPTDCARRADHDAEDQREDLRHGPLHEAQGGPALHPRPGQLRRRHPAARDAAHGHRAQPVRAREDQTRSTPSARWPSRACWR